MIEINNLYYRYKSFNTSSMTRNMVNKFGLEKSFIEVCFGKLIG